MTQKTPLTFYFFVNSFFCQIVADPGKLMFLFLFRLKEILFNFLFK